MDARLRTGLRLAALLLALSILPLLERSATPPAGAQTIPLPTGEEISIIRDSYGVPHVFAETREGMAYGAGYALAQDRLWQMEVLRRTAKGELSDLLGVPGSPIRPGLLEQDREVRFFTYTAEERARRFATYPEELRTGIQAFADGINAWILKARLPANTPFEFTEFGVPIEDWAVDDSIALGDVLILAFGSGGGNELSNAALLRHLVDTYGQSAGVKAFGDMVWINDPASPTSIPPDYNWRRSPTYARPEADNAFKLSLHTTDARLSLSESERGPAISAAASDSSLPASEEEALLAQLSLIPDLGAAQEALDHLARLEEFRSKITFGSNAQIGGPNVAEAGNTIQTGGPQVGYYVPQILVDIGLHAPGIDVTGMTFAGSGPAVLIGRGNGFAWTTTTGASDLTDTYVERLNPANPRQYQFNGQWENMDCRTETYTFRGAPVESEEICRTRHGPVLAFDEANNVAYSLRYAWFNAERGTVEGFFGFNTAESLQDFATGANLLTSNHNMFYTDDKGNYGYWHPGAHPIRKKGIDIRLPQDGTGSSEWRGIRTAQEVPHAVNFPRGWLANWNNKPSIDWDREAGWGAVFRSADLDDVMDPTAPRRLDPRGDGTEVINSDGKFSFDDFSANLRYAAHKEHNARYFMTYLPAGGADAQENSALAEVRAWDGFLMDRNADCAWDSAGVAIFQRWVSNSRSLAFSDNLGPFGSGSDSALLHVLQGNAAALRPRFDWLGSETPAQLASRAFSLTVDQLQTQFGNPDPSSWKGRASYQHYTRMNADLAADAARQRPCPYNGGPEPGNTPDHVRMDRGTYNHIVAYLDAPALAGPLGQSRERSGSVIPPGQSGHINSAGIESPPNYPVLTCPGGHYRDQFVLYTDWTYKPMPLARSDVESQQECTEVVQK
jgi:penicillin G amidase